MYYTDLPIKSANDDKLNRTVFAKNLATALLQFKSKEQFTIGLHGSWGSGKTSTINIMLEEIENQANHLPDKQKPIVIRFDPWLFTNKEQILTQFFTRLSTTLQEKSYSIHLKTAAKNISKYVVLLKYAEAIPEYGKWIKFGSILIEKIAKADESENIDIKTQKDKIISALENQEQRVIIIIDDIDRLPMKKYV